MLQSYAGQGNGSGSADEGGQAGIDQRTVAVTAEGVDAAPRIVAVATPAWNNMSISSARIGLGYKF